MPRYFFHFHFADEVQRDDEGLELPNLDDAISEAERARIQIMNDYRLDKLRIEVAKRAYRGEGGRQFLRNSN